MLDSRKVFGVLGGLLVCVLALGTIAGCGNSEGQNDVNSGEVPSSPEEVDNVVVRVSGTEGIAYLGNYGFLSGEPQTAEGTLEDEPTEYQVDEAQVEGAEGGASGGVTALFQKSAPGAGELRVEIVADNEVIAESRTRARTGTVVAEWLPEELLSPDGAIEEEEVP